MALYLKTLEGKEYTIGPIPTPIPCFQCGLCCTNVLVKLTSNELRILAHRLGVSNYTLLRKYVRKTPIGYVLRQTGNRCVFLSYDDSDTIAKCDIYAFRPEVCRNLVPSLSCPQCQEGLRRLEKINKIILPIEIYQNKGDATRLCSTIKNN